ncbi:MAG: hypothetical protein ACR2M4_07000 [Actinomycetota bacterium]
MTEPLTYVETTTPSFYHEVRTAPDIVVRRKWTRRWWDGALRAGYEPGGVGRASRWRT